MKLLTKTSIYLISITILLFLCNTVIIYQYIVFNSEKEANEHLRSEKKVILNGLLQGYLPEEIIAKTDKTKSIKLIEKQTLFNDKYSNDFANEAYEEGDDDELIKIKKLIFQAKIKNKLYEITITTSEAEVSEIGESLIHVVIICLCSTLIILFAANVIISKFIWSPFTNTLNQIKNWRVKDKHNLHLKDANIYEFKFLNQTLMDLITQIKTDYLNLKEFTENVSHEAQTPLAILSNKLELLLQEKNYSQAQADLLHKSYQAVQRLHKLNKALILLSRIDNKQFIEIQTIDLNVVIDDKLTEMEDFIDAKKITVVKNFSARVNVSANQMLLNIFIDNLFNNAIKYNLENDGTILIKINKTNFSIENTSNSEELDYKHLFDRMNKKSNSNSLGIGLSLIKKISDLYNWDMRYTHINKRHIFEITFQ